MTNKNITLNVWKNNSEFAMAVKGEVDSRFLIVKLVDNDGAIDLTDRTVKFLAKKPDGTVVFNNMTIDDADEGVASLELTSQMSAVAGILKDCEVQIINSGGDTLIAKGIDIYVKDSLGDTVIESLSESTAYHDMVESVEAMSPHIANKSNPHSVTAAQVGALPSTTKYGSTLEITGTTLKLKDQDGSALSTVTTQDTTYTAGANVSISDSNVISATDTTYAEATTSVAGLMSATDKAKIDGVADGSNVNVQSDWNQTDSDSDDYIKNKPTIPSAITDLIGTLPISGGGTNASNIYNAQSNLGLMKRYTKLTHLNLSSGYTIADIFAAMENNTYIELDISAVNVSLFPCNQGIVKFFRISANRAFAEYKCTINNGIAGSWVGYYHSNTSFSGWIKLYSGIDVIPIANGGTGAVTASAAITALGAASSNDLGNVSNLLTDSKTIVGAINELYNLVI